MLGLRRKEQQQNNPLASFATYLSRQRTCMSEVQAAWHQNSDPGSCAV